MAAYCLYAMNKWKVTLSQIQTYLLNVSSPNCVIQNQSVDEALLNKTRGVMIESIQSMRALLSDPVKNIPKTEEVFSFTENTRLCDFCNFYKICLKYRWVL